MPARGTDKHAYSHQKAEVERVLEEAVEGADVKTYVFRPCVVAGPDAHGADRPASLRALRGAGPRRPSAAPWAVSPACARCFPTTACRFSSSTTTTSRRRWSRRRSAGASPAYTTSPPTADITVTTSPPRWAGTRSRSRGGPSTSAPRSLAPAPAARGRGRLARGAPLADADGRRSRQRELGWAPAYDAGATLQDLVAGRA